MAAPSRRVLLGMLAAAPAMAGLTARPAAPSAFRIAHDRYRMAVTRFDGLPAHLEATDPAAHALEEAAFLAAVTAVDTTPVQSWEEFADAFLTACDDGESTITDETLEKLLADVRRLSGSAR